jgi:hypothetical protein
MPVLSRLKPAFVVWLCSLCTALSQPPDVPDIKPVPGAEVLHYNVEWRLIHAGNARLSWQASNQGTPGWEANLDLESAGLVSRLYKVDNHYSSLAGESLCAVSSILKAHEGSRHRETRVTFDRERGKAVYREQDLTKNTVNSKEIDIPACVYDVIGALYHLRTMTLEVGQSALLPVSDGKKSVMARVEAQERETIKTDAGSFKTVRYEAFLFNNVLYRRRGRLFIWLTDDNRRLPVQIRVRLPFYIGTVTLQLEKEGKG